MSYIYIICEYKNKYITNVKYEIYLFILHVCIKTSLKTCYHVWFFKKIMRLLYFSHKRYFHGGGQCFGLSPGGGGLASAGDKTSPKRKSQQSRCVCRPIAPASDTTELSPLLKFPPGFSGSPSLQAAAAPVSPGDLGNDVRTATSAVSSGNSVRTVRMQPTSFTVAWRPRPRVGEPRVRVRGLGFRVRQPPTPRPSQGRCSVSLNLSVVIHKMGP